MVTETDCYLKSCVLRTVSPHSRPYVIIMFIVCNRETSEIISLYATERRASLSVLPSKSSTKFQECREHDSQDCR